MSNNNQENLPKIKTQLILSDQINKEKKKLYEKLHKDLPPMKENQLNLMAAESKITERDKIMINAFVRSTVKKPIRLQTTDIVLLDQKGNILAQIREDFDALDTLASNTSRLFTFEFPKNKIDLLDLKEIENWSLAFKSKLKHRIDYSDLNQSEISESTKKSLNKIIKKVPLDKNELSFMGFSANFDESNNLDLVLLIRNGTNDQLDIKQLALNFHDATGDLTAQGTFKMDHLTILANTSKPITLVFPASSLLKDEIDLTSWSIENKN